MTNFQAESKKSGDEFEDLVLSDLGKLGFTDIQRHIVLEDIGVEADFLHVGHDGNFVFVEAKGGESGEKKRPGAQRTDNVKKAIANGSLIKAFYPDSQFVVYFSDLPRHGSSSQKMIKKAIQAGYVDAVRYLVKVV